MAAFYYDKITITKNPAGSGIYDFTATSNEGFVPTVNPVNTMFDSGNGDCEYTVPHGATNSNKVTFPTITIDFNSSIYTADKLITFTNVYPEFGNALDYKGGFSIKNTKYPPPRQTQHAFNFQVEARTLNFVKAQPKILLPLTIIGALEIDSIELTRVLDKTYTVKIIVKDTGIAPQYDVSGMYVLPDSSQYNKNVLVLAVTRNGTPKTVLTFDSSNLYVPIGDSGNSSGMPVIIYDETTILASSVAWRDVGYKNAALYFD